MRIALLAPVALPVPPCGYGGTELVIARLADGLVARGHAVTLFASGDSRTSAELRACYPEALTAAGYDTRETYQPKEDAHAIWSLAQTDGFDLIHDHTKTQGVLRAGSVRAPILTTLHNDFTPARRAIYTQHAAHRYVAISAAQARRCPELNYVGTVYNGIDLTEPRLERRKEGYLLFLGRLCEAKGTHTAIALANVLHMPLVLAGKVDPVDKGYFETQVAPHLDERIRYVGEVSGRPKWDLLAHARCLVFPIQWPEPFGLVMIEAMACGTPVIATRWGSVPEVVSHSVTGWIADDFEGLLEGVQRAHQLSPTACRRWVERRFSAEAMIEGYLKVYEQVLGKRSSARPSRIGTR